jgi:hypothetical protein
MKRIKGLYLLNASWVAIFSVLPPFVYSNQAWAVEGETLQSLPNGNYTVCSDLPKQFPQEKNIVQADADAAKEKAREELARKGQNVRKEDKGLDDLPVTKLINTCYIFNKTGNQVVGMYVSAAKTTAWCVSGVASGNSVTGYALSKGVIPRFFGVNSAKPNLNLAEIEPSLKVASVRVSSEGSFRHNGNLFQVGTVRYDKAVLDLNAFYLVNLKGSPPMSCDRISVTEFYNAAPTAKPEYFTDPAKPK